MQILTSFLGLFCPLKKVPPKKPRELCFVPYDKGDLMLKSDQGWRLAPEEDTNKHIGYVYLERDK